jgi:putative methionine-R-sulfoxide reductase with GAF domain
VQTGRDGEGGNLSGVIDLDIPLLGRFAEIDQKGL